MRMDEHSHPSLNERLKTLGVKVGLKEIGQDTAKREGSIPIHAVVQGSFHTTRQGETFVSEQSFPQHYRHGNTPISSSAHLNIISEWMKNGSINSLSQESFAYLDTETSGLAGGTGTYAFLVGVGRFIRNEFHLAQFFMRDPSEESAMLESVLEFLAPCKALVTFNGKAFDAPLLVTRYAINNIPEQINDLLHLDLLPLARRLWRDRLPSRALKYLEENILEAPRTTDEVPGYEIPYIYFDYLRTGDASPLKGVFYHNAMDVVALAALMNHIASVLQSPFDGQVQHGLDYFALGKLFEDLNHWDEAARLYEKGLESGLTKDDFGAVVKRLSSLQRRRGNLDLAVTLWREAAEDGHVYAHIELAKYYEHHLSNIQEALKWSNLAEEIVEELDIPRYEYRHWKEELEHRKKRLMGKLHK